MLLVKVKVRLICHRCGGNIFKDYDDILCLQCGWYKEVSMKRVVKTIWQHQVAIPDFEVRNAIRKEQPIIIIVPNTGTMTLQSNELLDRKLREGLEVFQDKYGGGNYKLWYYLWKPDAVQAALVP